MLRLTDSRTSGDREKGMKKMSQVDSRNDRTEKGKQKDLSKESVGTDLG